MRWHEAGGPGSFDRFFGIAWFEGFVRDAGVCGDGQRTFIRCVAISFLTGGCSDAESEPGVADISKQGARRQSGQLCSRKRRCFGMGSCSSIRKETLKSMKRKAKQHLALILAIVLGMTSGLGGVAFASST